MGRPALSQPSKSNLRGVKQTQKRWNSLSLVDVSVNIQFVPGMFFRPPPPQIVLFLHFHPGPTTFLFVHMQMELSCKKSLRHRIRKWNIGAKLHLKFKTMEPFHQMAFISRNGSKTIYTSHSFFHSVVAMTHVKGPLGCFTHSCRHGPRGLILMHISKWQER